MIPDFQEDMVERPAWRQTRPQAPVLVIGRDRRFLDVRPTVRDAEEHLAQETQTGMLRIDACEYFDGVARPLEPTITEDGTVTLNLADGQARPETLRERVNRLLGSAQETYDPDRLPWDSQVDGSALEPFGDEYSFPRFLDALDRRFNDDGTSRHSAGRLHNFWHAIS